MLRKYYKGLSYLAIAFVCIFSLTVTSLAATRTNLRMTNIQSANCVLSFANGNAVANADLVGNSNAQKCKIVLNIQEKQGTRWVTVDTCTEETSIPVASASTSIKATKGTTYRAQATVTVWVNGISESKTVTTQGETA